MQRDLRGFCRNDNFKAPARKGSKGNEVVLIGEREFLGELWMMKLDK